MQSLIRQQRQSLQSLIVEGSRNRALHLSGRLLLQGAAARSNADVTLTVPRYQSTWNKVPRKQQQQQYYNSKKTQRPQQSYSSLNANRRPVINGKPIAFHVNELPQQQTTATEDSQPLQQPFLNASSSPSYYSNDLQEPYQQQQYHQHQQDRFYYEPIREYETDLVVVLDLDECLIHSQFLQGPGAKYAHQVQRAGGVNYDSAASDVVDTFQVYLPEAGDGEEIRVYERPHLHEFLARVSEKYETHIFTAAQDVYAKPILKVLDPHGKIFSHCWYRESCDLDQDIVAYVKDLKPMFGRRAGGRSSLKRTVLVDNNPLSFLANPENGILVSSFYNDPRDTTLVAVLDLLEELEQERDVRPKLDARFGLRKALQDLSKGREFSGRDRQLDEASGVEEENDDEEEASTSFTATATAAGSR